MNIFTEYQCWEIVVRKCILCEFDRTRLFGSTRLVYIRRIVRRRSRQLRVQRNAFSGKALGGGSITHRRFPSPTRCRCSCICSCDAEKRSVAVAGRGDACEPECGTYDGPRRTTSRALHPTYSVAISSIHDPNCTVAAGNIVGLRLFSRWMRNRAISFSSLLRAGFLILLGTRLAGDYVLGGINRQNIYCEKSKISCWLDISLPVFGSGASLYLSCWHLN